MVLGLFFLLSSITLFSRDFVRYFCTHITTGYPERKSLMALTCMNPTATPQVRTKLGGAFEDCMMDIMDQLWGALQYAGSKHAIVERMAEVGSGGSDALYSPSRWR